MPPRIFADSADCRYAALPSLSRFTPFSSGRACYALITTAIIMRCFRCFADAAGFDYAAFLRC